MPNEYYASTVNESPIGWNKAKQEANNNAEGKKHMYYWWKITNVKIKLYEVEVENERKECSRIVAGRARVRGEVGSCEMQRTSVKLRLTGSLPASHIPSPKAVGEYGGAKDANCQADGQRCRRGFTPCFSWRRRFGRSCWSRRRGRCGCRRNIRPPIIYKNRFIREDSSAQGLQS